VAGLACPCEIHRKLLSVHRSGHTLRVHRIRARRCALVYSQSASSGENIYGARPYLLTDNDAITNGRKVETQSDTLYGARLDAGTGGFDLGLLVW
jgi:hypothetical protein